MLVRLLGEFVKESSDNVFTGLSLKIFESTEIFALRIKYYVYMWQIREGRVIGATSVSPKN